MDEITQFVYDTKMHKVIPKERYLAASHTCTTKTLSGVINKCLKLLTLQHRKYCNKIYVNTGVNRMWVIDNAKNVLDKIEQYNDERNIRNVNSYDFSTLYTKIPHEDLKEKIKWIIDKAFFNDSKQFIYVNNHNATWNRRSNAHKISQEQLIKHVNYLIDNIYIQVGDHVFKQVVGIPMGTDCAPFLANLYLYALEFKYMEKLTKTDIHTARKFSNSFRYIDDLLTFNHDNLINEHKHKIYPKEMVLNKENKSDKHTSFLDINIKIIDANHTIHTSIYDKRDDFNFEINNFPNLSGNIHKKRSHGIIISQLIRYSKVCMSYNDFVHRSKIMSTKLISQFFDVHLLKRKFSFFYDKYYNLIKKYDRSKKQMIYDIF